MVFLQSGSCTPCVEKPYVITRYVSPPSMKAISRRVPYLHASLIEPTSSQGTSFWLLCCVHRLHSHPLHASVTLSSWNKKLTTKEIGSRYKVRRHTSRC